MKLNVFVSAVALLGAFQPRYECRAIENPGAAGRSSSSSLPGELQQLSLPILLRLGEEYFIRLDDAKQNAIASSPGSSDPDPSSPRDAPPPPAATVNRALQLRLTQRLLQSKVGGFGRFLGGYDNRVEDLDSAERGKRSDPPISLDLTFHLLREVLEMARAEQLAQQASTNRKMMDIYGK